MGLKKNKVKKYIEYFTTKVKLLVHQKTFFSEGVTYRYMLDKEESDSIVVVFSSCTRKGLKARYNYVRTLKPVKANKLFILDDFGKDGRGSYYLGKDMNFNEEKAALDLIKSVVEKTKAKKIICCGSSKGGWSSLNFGLQIPGSYIVSGGPQFFLGTYLLNSDNMDAIEHITGGVTKEKVAVLDEYLKNRIANNEAKNQKIYLHYSDKEHTYDEHIKFLLCELRNSGYKLTEDIGTYTDHSEISLHFPDFLFKTVSMLVSED